MLAQEGLSSDHWNQKGGTHFLGHLPWVLHLRNGSELSQPVWGIHQAGSPIQPYFHISDGWFRLVTASSPNVWTGPRHLLGMHCLPPLCRQGNPTGPFCMHPKKALTGFSVGSSTYIRLYFQFPKSCLPLQPMLAWGPWVPVQGLALGVSSTVAAGTWIRGILYPPAYLLISCIGSLQWLLMSLSGLTMLVSSSSRLGLLQMDRRWNGHSSPLQIFLGGSSVGPPMQMAPQRG